MKRIKKIKNQILLHPMMAFLLLAGVVVLASGILDLFDASVTYSKINPKTGSYETALVTVESLLNLSGIKYIFSNTVANFVNFTPLSMLLIALIGIGIMDKTGFLDTLFFLLTKNVSKKTVTWFLALTSIVISATGDLTFVVMIPLAALLFKYGKRNPLVGIITAFAAVSLGYTINLYISGVDSNLISLTEQSATIILGTYKIKSLCYLFVMLPATFTGASIVTYVTEYIIAPRLGKYESDEEEEVIEKDSLTRRELRGLLLASFGAFIYLLVFIYNIIPNVPFGGNLLDYSQSRYIDKLFGLDSFFNSGFVFVIVFLFFILGLLYGLGTKTISNHRDICNDLSHSLDGIGKVIVLIFCASMFISLLKYTNIGLLLTAWLTNLISGAGFGGIPLILMVFIISMLSTILTPTLTLRWPIMSSTIVPMMMTAGFSPEFAQLIFSAGSSIVYPLTPAMAYFVIYISFMEKYDKDGVGLIKCIKYMIPYAILFAIMWIAILILFYMIGIPLGIQAASVI